MVLAYRIYVTQWEPEDQFARLLSFLNRHRPAIDELALFSDYWHHGYTPPELFARRTAVLAERIDQLRQHGYTSVGANVITTLGHFPEASDFLAPLPFPPMVGHNGVRSTCSPCPNTRAFREYITERYRMAARAKPDFIWVDDDMRMESHGEVMYGCFCPTCLERFTQAFGHEPLAREAVVAQLDSPEGGTWREEWIEFNVRVIEDLLAEIARAIHEIDASIDVGLMTIGPTINTYSGQDIERWMRALGGRRVRPGHGFYDDGTPRGMIDKALEVGRQCQATPASVTQIQYELENFPYNKLDKAVRTTLNECTLALMAGCNGVAFNALKPLPGSYDDFEDLLAGIEAERGRWDRLVSAVEGLPPAGLWPAADPRLMARRRVRADAMPRRGSELLPPPPFGPRGGWFAPDPAYDIQQPNPLAELGLPLTTSAGNACATLLAGRIAEILDDDALRQVLSGGVLLDAEALQVLWERGVGELAGVRPGPVYNNGMRELFTDHALNGPHAGEGRDVRMSAFRGMAQGLIPTSPDTGILAQFVSYDEALHEPSMVVYANPLGGRIVTMGYAPWYRLGSGHKRAQLTAAADWAAQGRLPILIERSVRVVPFLRMGPSGERLVAALLNTSLDATGPLSVRLRTSATRVQLLGVEELAALPAERHGGELWTTLPDIAPWHCAVVVAD